MNKYQKLAGNTLVFAVGSFGAKLLSFLLVRLYTNRMSPSDYSTADLIYQTVNVLYPLVTLSMADAIIRYGVDKAYDNKKVYSIAIFSTIAGMTLLAILSPLFGLIDAFKGYGFLIYVYCYCSGFRQLASSFVRARGYVKLFALDGVGSTLNIVIWNVIFLVGFNMGVTGYILSIIISDVLSFLFLTVIASLHKFLDFKFVTKDLFKEMLKYSAPLIPTYVLWWVTSASDRWFVIEMVSKDDNGIYSAAYKIPTLLMLVTTLFFQAWQMSAIENKDDKDLGKFYGQIYNAYTSLLFIAAAGIIMIVKPFTFVLLDEEYRGAYQYTPLLIIAMLFQCFCQFLSSVYNVKKKSMNSMLTSLVAAVVNIILNLLLIPKYEVYGAAVATIAAYFSCYIIRIFDSRSYVPFKVAHAKIVINFIVIFYMSAVSILEPSMKYIQLIVLFVLITLFNFDSILNTLSKIFNKNKRPAGSHSSRE